MPTEPHRLDDWQEEPDGRLNPGDEPPLISVVIPSYNSARYIRPCLQAVLSQVASLPFEVILVDSSGDGTDRIVANEFPQVRLFHFRERRAPGTARNIGIEKARGEIILFLDTDCIADPTWMAQMVAAIQDLGVDGVGGAMRNGTPWSIGGSIGFYLEFFRVLAYNGKPYATLFLVGGNCGFRKEVFRQTQYTDRSTSEDWVFNWQLIQQGKRLLFLPSVAMKHMNKVGLSTILRYQYRIGLGACAYRRLTSPKVMRVLERFPPLAFLMPLGIVPWIAGTVLRRRGVFEFLKFAALSPLVLVTNSVWAAGFYRGLLSGQLP